ncbi:YifB family Mg chelatase-like AAA ATPase [Leifsonia shinshuensis]|uniref:YifB family Mg chelatase-like AAA ATPase n=1 Tax=Leifsonia shinshuensis TaxID=150026 RepID=UPI00285FCE20|nr:YifB family Mg chelatase-like AAA ATPase [Leifsonia shinshuensis]MDR6970251.1 magnesium chelatase family protein [Leifsonia shinshuensis]
MALARTFAIALDGVRGHVVEVEADISAGLPSFVLIGLPDTALGESCKRVGAAAVNAGCPLSQKKLTVNLSPAALPKQGSGFDLAIAIAALAAAGAVPREAAASAVHLGELGLDGRVRPVPGILPAVLAARDAGFATVLVPAGNLDEARLVDGLEVVGVTSLRAAAIRHGAGLEPVDEEPVAAKAAAVSEAPEPDMAEVAGNDEAVEALVAAAAGGHHLSMVGPPGAGKTMLAQRLPSLLPDLSDDAALEATCIRSLAGPGAAGRLVRRPPFEAPHHTASAVALVGGGSGRITPGAIVRATHGVLFLDEAAEFPPSVLDALRQPLENGRITIHRASGAASFPARFQLVLASNPCPCGRYGSSDAECTCSPMARRRYLARLSGPLLDRVDIRLTVRTMGLAVLRSASDEGATRRTSAQLRRRVEAARARAAERLRGTEWARNAEVAGSWLRANHRLGASAIAPLDRALERGAITMRGYDRTLRLAWTLADLDATSSPDVDHVGRALFLRRGIGA